MKKIIFLLLSITITISLLANKNSSELITKKTSLVKTEKYVYVHTKDEYIIDKIEQKRTYKGMYMVDDEFVYYYKLDKYFDVKILLQTALE
jgi:hypothetical protein